MSPEPARSQNFKKDYLHEVSTIRQNQVAEMIRRNFSLVLQDEGKYIFDNDSLVTVTSVRMSPDLGLAKIYLSVYNTDNKQAVILCMDEEKARLKQSLGHRIRKQIRHIPDIDFYLDDTLDEMYRLNALFNQMHKEGQMGEEE